jgi:sugar/nucleoside kinase (ribokinase family)
MKHANPDRPKVAVIGLLAIDSIYRIKTFPIFDQVALINKIGHYYGGYAGNISSVLQQLGLQVSIIALAGNNFVTSGYEDSLIRKGIDISQIQVFPDTQCAHFMMIKDEFGKGYALFLPNVESDHNSDLRINNSLISDCDILCISKFNARETFEFFLRNKKRKAISAVAISDEFLILENKSLLLKILGNANYIFMNSKQSERALSVLSLSSPEKILTLPKTKLISLIITRAESGSTIYSKTNKEPLLIPAVQPSQLINDLGAGDTYMGAFVFGLSKNWGLKKCGEFAATLASFALEQEGAQIPNLSSRDIQNRIATVFEYKIDL